MESQPQNPEKFHLCISGLSRMRPISNLHYLSCLNIETFKKYILYIEDLT